MVVNPELLPKQKLAFRTLLDDHTTEILYGGGVGGGKSYLGAMWVIIMCLQYEGIRMLVGRSKLTQLKLTTLKTMFEVLQTLHLKEGEHWNFNGQTNVFTFYNGSEVILKDLFLYPSDPEYDSLGSLELTGAFVDEASQVSFKAFQVIKSRFRYKIREYDITPKILLTTNPSQNWLYEYFYKPYTDNELEDYKCFIPALPTDNPHLPVSYITELHKLPEESRKRLLEGNWDYDSSIDQLFSYSDINMCFGNDLEDGQKYITADIASYGDDRSVICLWNGLNLVSMDILTHQSIPNIAEKIKSLKTSYNVPLKNIIVDADGLGIGVKDLLGCKGFQNNSRPLKNGNYNNLKSQCYFLLSEYIKGGKINFGDLKMSIREDLSKELIAHKIKDVDKDGKNQVIPKEQIKKMIGKSPDISDSIMFRMWYELQPKGSYKIMSGGGVR
jgi:phage terminase large subunit